MDLMGVEAYYRVMRDLLPDLSTAKEIPRLMRDVVESGEQGIRRGRGLYRYTDEEEFAREKGEITGDHGHLDSVFLKDDRLHIERIVGALGDSAHVVAGHERSGRRRDIGLCRSDAQRGCESGLGNKNEQTGIA